MRRVGLSLASLSIASTPHRTPLMTAWLFPALRLDAAVQVATPAMLGREGVEVGQHAYPLRLPQGAGALRPGVSICMQAGHGPAVGRSGSLHALVAALSSARRRQLPPRPPAAFLPSGRQCQLAARPRDARVGGFAALPALGDVGLDRAVVDPLPASPGVSSYGPDVGESGAEGLSPDASPAGWRANFYPTGLNDSVVASAYEPSVPL